MVSFSLTPQMLVNNFDKLSEFDHFQLLGDLYFFRSPLLSELLKTLSKEKSISLHFVGLNLAGRKPEKKYIEKVEELLEITDPILISDHAGITSNEKEYFFDIFPVPKNNTSIKTISDNVSYFKNLFSKDILIENISQYITFDEDEYSEREFIKYLAVNEKLPLLFDLNNYTLNRKNLDKMDDESIKQDVSDLLEEIGINIEEVHLAGPGEDHVDSIQIDKHTGDLSQVVKEVLMAKGKFFDSKKLYLEWESGDVSFGKMVAKVKHINQLLGN